MCITRCAQKLVAKKRSRSRGAAPVLGMAMSVGCAPSVRAVQSTLPRRPSGGRRAKLFSKSLPQEEPTVARRRFRLSASRRSTRDTFRSAPFKPPCIAFAMVRTLLLSILSLRFDAETDIEFRCQVKSRCRVLRAEAHLAPRVIRSLNLAKHRASILSGVLRMANRSEAAFSPKRHS